MNILVINSGSSSLKYKLFDMDKQKSLVSGVAERIGGTDSFIKHENGEKTVIDLELPNHKVALKEVLDLLTDPKLGVIKSLDEIDAVGHRILHGQEVFTESVILDKEKVETLKGFIEMGPLHMPANIGGIEACFSLMPNVPQIGAFDTAFHATIPAKAHLYALPYDLYESFKIRRYGFHGTSHKYVTNRAAEFLGKSQDDLKMITLHLGNGSSMAAVKNGKCIDTSMGFTPLEGLVMGTRCGDMDPAIVPYIGKKLDMTPDEVDTLMNKESGLKGFSGLSNDMRDIQQARSEGNKLAQLVYEMFVYRIVKYVGAYTAALGGLDCMVFTAGIGENDYEARRDICKELAFMGVFIDEELNDGLKGKETRLSTKESKVEVLLIPTNEELSIALDTYKLVK
ncbi:MAG: acetate kinase [Firmicutes bacterium]|nr:acetate kinase [Bacillota bacterium]MDD4264022.1 acetate kinase [Bacillota bacterium]MDD4693002.1 acetate kinase [Bacillota bacterium]